MKKVKKEVKRTLCNGCLFRWEGHSPYWCSMEQFCLHSPKLKNLFRKKRQR
jgi:hypothetical protein